MQRENKQIKVNIPTSQKSILAFCDFLSAQRMLSTTVIRLLQAEMQKQGYGASKLPTNQQQSIFK